MARTAVHEFSALPHGQFGLALPSHVPPRRFRQLRQLTRYRRKLAAERSRNRNRVHKTRIRSGGFSGPNDGPGFRGAKRWGGDLGRPPPSPPAGASMAVPCAASANVGERVCAAAVRSAPVVRRGAERRRAESVRDWWRTGPELLILAAWGAASFGAALWIFRWR